MMTFRRMLATALSYSWVQYVGAEEKDIKI